MTSTEPVRLDSSRAVAAVRRGRGPIRVDQVLGSRLDPPFDVHLDRLARRGACEHLLLTTADLAPRRLDAVGTLGTEVRIDLPWDAVLFDGAVIACTDHHAVVVHVTAGR
jgi:urease accessory protein UreE